jgi:hypothetical protein
VTLTPGDRHGRQNVSLTATAASYPGFTASAPLSFDVRGKPGALDTSFAGGGVLELPFDMSPRDVAVSPDDRIVVAGGSGTLDGAFDIARVLPTGVVDASFGTGGRTRAIAGGGLSGEASCVAVAPNGGVFAGGSREPQLGGAIAMLVAVDNAGAKVPTFGDAGVVEGLVGDYSACMSIRLLPDGRLVAVHEVPLYRRLPGGPPDPTFGDAGVAFSSYLLGGAVVEDNGGLVLAGVLLNASAGQLTAVVLGPSGKDVRGNFISSDPACLPSRPLRLANGTTVLVARCSAGVGASPASPRLVGLAADAGVAPAFGDAGVVNEPEIVTSIQGVAVDGGLATVRLDALDTSGAPNPRIVLVAYDEKGTLLWTTAKSTFSALAGVNPIAAATDHTGRVVLLGGKGGAAGARAVLARFWL